MVGVFGLVRDLLADDGTLWLNLGDSYATGAGSVGDRPGGAQGDAWAGVAGSRGGSAKQPQTASAIGPLTQPNRMPIPGLKPKDLCGIPWRVAFALQADGWWLRQDIIWSKKNCMPESVTDRCTKSHEYLFLLSKRERYYYDAAAIAEPAALGARRLNGGHSGNGDLQDNGRQNTSELVERNKRSVWTVATQPYSEAHFATFPPALIEPCILAGSRPGDVVLDPFFGSGTTGEVCERLGRRWIGCELSPEYGKLAAKRTAQQGMMFAQEAAP